MDVHIDRNEKPHNRFSNFPREARLEDTMGNQRGRRRMRKRRRKRRRRRKRKGRPRRDF